MHELFHAVFAFRLLLWHQPRPRDRPYPPPRPRNHPVLPQDLLPHSHLPFLLMLRIERQVIPPVFGLVLTSVPNPVRRPVIPTVFSPVLTPVPNPVHRPLINPVILPVFCPVLTPVMNKVLISSRALSRLLHLLISLLYYPQLPTDSTTFMFQLKFKPSKLVDCDWLKKNQNPETDTKHLAKYCPDADVATNCCASCP